MTRWKGLAVFAFALRLSGDVDQWPQYRGPDGAGVSASAAPVEFGAKQNVRWRAELEPGHSSPSIWGDRLFLTSFGSASKQLQVFAYDRRNGRLLWRREVPAAEIEKVHAVSSPATATPVVDGERVYVYFGSAGLFCFDLEGKLLWSRPMPTAKVDFGSGVSPALAGDSIILARDDGDRHMLAVERKTGEVRWDVKLGGDARGPFAGHATPAIWKDQIILHRPTEVVAYDMRDGSRRWWVKLSSQGTGTPVIHEGMIFVGAWGSDTELMDPVPDWKTMLQKYDKNGDGAIDKGEFPGDLAIARRVDAGDTPGAVVTFKKFFDLIDANKDGQISESEWNGVVKMISQPNPLPHGLMAIRLGGSGDVTRSNVAWRQEHAVPEVPVPLVYRGRVYTVTNGGIVSILDESSGRLIYRGRLGPGGLYYSSPVAAGDHIYFASGEGIVTVVKAGDKLDVVARNNLGEPIFATPAIVEGGIYVRTASHLYAFGQ
jgi:outer membrane protein assembly factor BamB